MTKQKDDLILPNGEYEVTGLLDGKRTAVTVKKVGGSKKRTFFFRRFMERYYPVGAIFRSDGTGGIELLK